MVRISFTKNRQPIEVPEGSNLLRCLLDAGIPVASSCGGDGVCLKCPIKIIAGSENLSPETDFEAELRDIYELPKDERISCQTKVLGPITIDTTYW